MSEHTPGPWRVAWLKFDAAIVRGDSGAEIGYVNFATGKDSECEANARLIAAAPELLEALKAMLDDEIYADGEGLVNLRNAESADAARTAIAKAEGRES